jgi:hypothetical protein
MKITSTTIALVSASILTACGGGGSSSPSSTTQPVVASKLAAYAGVWATPCDGHELTTLTVSEAAGAKDTLTVVPKTEYFTLEGCTGPVVGTETQSGNYTIAYTGVADAGVVFSAGAGTVTTKIDLVTLSAPALRVSIIGSGVVHSINSNGQAQWCMDFGNGNTACVNDYGLEPAIPATNTALHINGNKMYTLSASGSIYGVDESFTKR